MEILKKKTYDFLDIRRTDFDDDYDQFKRAITNLHVRLENYSNNTDFATVA